MYADHLLQETESVIVGSAVCRCFPPEHVYPAAGGVQDIHPAVGDEAALFISAASYGERGDEGMA